MKSHLFLAQISHNQIFLCSEPETLISRWPAFMNFSLADPISSQKLEMEGISQNVNHLCIYDQLYTENDRVKD